MASEAPRTSAVGPFVEVDYFRAAHDSASSLSNLPKQATSPALEHWSLPACGEPLDSLALGLSRRQTEQFVRTSAPPNGPRLLPPRVAARTSL
jgi:hypothetical protein